MRTRNGTRTPPTQGASEEAQGNSALPLLPGESCGDPCPPLVSAEAK